MLYLNSMIYICIPYIQKYLNKFSLQGSHMKTIQGKVRMTLVTVYLSIMCAACTY